MAITAIPELQNQVEQIYQSLSRTESMLNLKSPSMQIQHTASLPNNSPALENLQEKVQACLKHLQKESATSEIQSCIVMNDTLENCRKILNHIWENVEIAKKCVKIEPFVEKINVNFPSASEIAAVEKRILKLKSKREFLNQGSQSALATISQNLQNIKSQHIALFINQYKDIERNFTQNPIRDFEAIVNHYSAVTEYVSCNPFTLNNLSIKLHLQNVEKILHKIIAIQENKEKSGELPQTQDSATENCILEEIKAYIEQLIDTVEMEHRTFFFIKIDKAYQMLSSEDKNKVFNSLENVLQEIKHDVQLKKDIQLFQNIDLGVKFRNQSFTTLPGTWKEKKEALEKILSVKSPITSDTLTIASDKMKSRFVQVQNKWPIQTKLDLTSRSYLPEKGDLDNLSFQGEVSPSQNVCSKNISIIKSTINKLQTLLSLLEPNASDEDLKKACQVLISMDSNNCKDVFKINGTCQQMTVSRPFFHIYLIHKNESPKNPYLFDNKTNNENRRRAVIRATVEFTLKILENATKIDDKTTLIQLVDILEKLKLDVRDRIDKQENVAGNLYDAFYHLHLVARYANASLIDPHTSQHASQFQGNFGRNAFCETMNGINPAIKIAAIERIHNLLKKAWKLL